MKRSEFFLILILAVVQFTHILDVMMIMPLGKQFMELWDITPAEFSFIVSSYAYAAAVSGILSAFVLDRFDRKQALFFLYIGFTISTFWCAIAPTYPTFLTARLISGGFGGILTAVIFSIIGDVFIYEKRGRATSYVMMAFSVASVIGVPAGIWIAANFDWRMTFKVIGGLASVFIFLIYFKIPSLRKHLENGIVERNPIRIFSQIFKDANQRNTLIFSMALIFGHFAIIPFIAPYMQLNIGFSDNDIAFVYFVGGLFSVVFLPLFGNLSDRFGKQRIFTISTFLAIGSIFWITNLPPVGIVIGILATSSYFVASGGRNVPATAIVTSVVKPESRGSFMSIRTAVNQFAIGASSQIAGFIIAENADGSLGNYEIVGYFAIVMSFVALGLVFRLRVVS